MEWTALILEHLVQIIHYIAWPSVVLFILILFRKELGLLVGRIEEYQHGDKRVVFSTANRQGGTRELPISEPATETEKTAELSDEAKRILATIWQRQKHHFEDDFIKRWSFRVIPNSAGYGIFILGFAELLKLGLVGWTRKEGQAVLTDKGIKYIKNHPDIQESKDVYRFGSK